MSDLSNCNQTYVNLRIGKGFSSRGKLAAAADTSEKSIQRWEIDSPGDQISEKTRSKIAKALGVDVSAIGGAPSPETMSHLQIVAATLQAEVRALKSVVDLLLSRLDEERGDDSEGRRGVSNGP